MSYQIPRHWEEDRPVTFEEWQGSYGPVVCGDCDTPITSFDMVAKRMIDEAMLDITFSDEEIVPVYEIVCIKCADV